MFRIIMCIRLEINQFPNSFAYLIFPFVDIIICVILPLLRKKKEKQKQR